MGPSCGLKVERGADILYDHDSKACQRVACQLCRQQCRYQGRGTKRTIFLLVERGGPVGKVLVHRWLPECYQQWKGKYDHQIKQNNGKENVFKHIFQGYILPNDKQSMISMTGYKVENHLGKGEGIS